jgi:hypothetical protein
MPARSFDTIIWATALQVSYGWELHEILLVNSEFYNYRGASNLMTPKPTSNDVENPENPNQRRSKENA